MTASSGLSSNEFHRLVSQLLMAMAAGQARQENAKSTEVILSNQQNCGTLLILLQLTNIIICSPK